MKKTLPFIRGDDFDHEHRYCLPPLFREENVGLRTWPLAQRILFPAGVCHDYTSSSLIIFDRTFA